jgi:hypothetical protein
MLDILFLFTNYYIDEHQEDLAGISNVYYMHY